MKKLAKTLSLALLFSMVCFACEPLSGDLEDVSSSPELISPESGGGGEDGGQTGPDGNKGGS